jgi:Sensors of blue-light using FAD
MLVRCLYASRCAPKLDGSVLDSILEECLRNNPERGITGILCHADDTFVQIIEGGRDVICELYNTIVRDERHSEVRLLSYEEIEERRFANWSMGHVNLHDINPGLLLKYSEKAVFDPLAAPARATLCILDELIAIGAITSRAGAV